MNRRQLLSLVGAGLAFPGAALAQQPTVRNRARTRAPTNAGKGIIALSGGQLHRAGQPPLDDALVVIEDGKIASIAPRGTSAHPPGALVVDVTGKIVTGGLIDPLTKVGVAQIDLEEDSRDDWPEAGRTISAGFAVADGYDPASPLVAVTRKEGLTSVGVVPSGSLVAGQSAWADLAGDTPDEALASRSLALHVLIGDYALGRGDDARGGGINSATAFYLLRQLFDDAAAYRANKAGYERRLLRKLSISRLDLEVVARALEGALPVVFHADRASDLLVILQLIRDRKLRGAVASAAEGWKVARELSAAKVPAIVYPLDDGPRDFSAIGAREDNAALLHKAGVDVAMASGESHNARKLRQIAGNAVRAGMPHAAALDAVTDAPARIFGMGRYGAPAVGRIANLAVWSGDPFEPASRVERLFIRGQDVSLRTRQTALFEKYR